MVDRIYANLDEELDLSSRTTEVFAYDNYGDEIIKTGSADDQIFWVAGNDIISGGLGSDTLKLQGEFSYEDFDIVNISSEESFSLRNKTTEDIIQIYDVENIHFIQFDWVDEPFIGSSIPSTAAKFVDGALCEILCLSSRTPSTNKTNCSIPLI